MLSSGEVPQTSVTGESVQSPLYPAQDPVPAPRPVWTYYHKPIFVMVLGAMVLCTAVVLYLLNVNEVGGVPQVMGPVCLSIGLMFIIVAVVWLPIIKDKLKRKGLKTSDPSADVE
uniref:Uncharacterized protein n=1 Tax=Electrophorus electricus TaxID=8005 RepID=A0AAY5EWN3_ELEEL